MINFSFEFIKNENLIFCLFLFIALICFFNFLFMFFYFYKKKENINKNSIELNNLKNSRVWINDLIKSTLYASQLEISLNTIIFSENIELYSEKNIFISAFIEYKFLKILINGISKEETTKNINLFINNNGEIKAFSIVEKNEIKLSQSSLSLFYSENNKKFSIVYDDLKNKNEILSLSPAQTITSIEKILKTNI